MTVLLTSEMPYAKPEHFGPVTIKVWWADGRVTSQTGKWSRVLDVLSGHPFDRWEIHGSTEAPVRGEDESWAAFGYRLAELGLESELECYQWLGTRDWTALVEGFRSYDAEVGGKPYPHFDTRKEVEA